MKLYSRIDFSIIALAIANLVPVAGVVWFEWNATAIILLYWSENVIIGFYNVLKLALAKMEVEHPLAGLCKPFVIPFFASISVDSAPLMVFLSWCCSNWAAGWSPSSVASAGLVHWCFRVRFIANKN